MKLKELKRTVNVSWSPAEHYPVLLAAGSAGQQVDASFSSNSYLEIYGLNLQDPGLDLELKSSLQTKHKFQKLVWSGANVIVGGCDGGLLEFYSADKLLKNSSEALLGTSTKHSGHVSALDINPYQKNLLASGASESEIFIWDLNNTSQPMAPGNKSQPYDHVQGLAWNQQVQHILGSTFSTRCVVWDLRKNEPIMKLSDSQSRTRWRSLAWHPSVATQLCIASEDDQAPVIQLWDLRLAASPLVTMEGHSKGVMSVSWSPHDTDLLLSAGKDGRLLCWNPNDTTPGGRLLLELARQPQWLLEAAWSPRAAALLAASSFDQQLAVHSLLGGAAGGSSTAAQSSNILESFGAASLGELPLVARPAPAPLPQLPAAPRWLRRPARGKFAFGGKLLTFGKSSQEGDTQRHVYISQVVSEPEIVEKAAEVDAILNSCLSQDPSATEQLAEYCRQQGDASSDQTERYMWFFLRASFLPSFRGELLDLLGFKQDDIPSKFKSSGDVTQPDIVGLSRQGESTETEAELSTDTSTDVSDVHALIERKLANLDLAPAVNNVVIPNGEDSTSLICRALVCGNLEEAVELCLDAKRVADALIIASLGSQELLYKVQKYHLNQTAQDPVSLLAGSLLQSKWDQLVEGSSPRSWRETLAALITHCDGEALAHYCEMLGDKLSKESDPSFAEARTLSYLCALSPRSFETAPRSPPAHLPRLALRALLAHSAPGARRRQIQPGGKIYQILSEYALLLVSQGCLQSALNILEVGIDSDLKERLQRALGLVQRGHQAYTQNAAAAPRPRAAPARKGSHVLAHSDVSNTYSAVPPAYEPQSWQQASVPAAFPTHSQPGYHPQPPIQPPTQPPTHPPQPPRPGSVGPQSGGITSRSKYKVDPSVQSAPLYNQYSFNNQQQPYGGFNSPIPDQYGSSVPNPLNPTNQMNPMANQMNPLSNQMNQMSNQMNPMSNQMNPLSNQMNPMSNQMNPMSNQMNPMGNQMNSISNQPNPAVNGGYYNPQPVESAPQVQSKPVPPGWNDPPMLSSKPKPKPEVSSAPAPITHPLFGAEPQHVPLNPMLPQQSQQQLPQQSQQYGYEQFAPQYGVPPQNFSRQVESPAPVAQIAEPQEKSPIPEQHIILQSVFDGLRKECADRAPNPQTKRKLDDVQRRLETLYDLLRDYRLSENALSTLHGCVSHAQRGEYDLAAQLSTSLATGPDFATVASFLPGLKVLLQLAGQLQVYMR
ncbi:protein transport protein Sec31A isoform X3 [Amyelois transitella]|uniref:protein transport protein Sec31A isoform X3 n=1 Tax=Amyelois transitella TaxID=680683 RepID=UPI00298F95B6|nr:protein transport protein Sec31A isoform X3 [Amyelois transitella]